MFAAALGHFVNTDIKAWAAYLDRANSHPAVMCTTGHFSTKAHYKHTITTHKLTYTNMYAHSPSRQHTHKHTVPVENCLSRPFSLPSFSFFSSGVCITGSHRHFLVLSRDILAPDSRSLARCSSGPWILD